MKNLTIGWELWSEMETRRVVVPAGYGFVRSDDERMRGFDSFHRTFPGGCVATTFEEEDRTGFERETCGEASGNGDKWLMGIELEGNEIFLSSGDSIFRTLRRLGATGKPPAKNGRPTNACD
jgi:hypothetical protein